MKNIFVIAAMTVLAIFASSPTILAGDCRRAAGIMEDGARVLSRNPTEAESLFREALTYCRDSASGQYNLGLALYLQKNLRGATGAFEEAVRLKPEFGNALNALATVNLEMSDGDIHYARRLAQRAVDLEPTNRNFQDTLAATSNTALDIDTPPITDASKPYAVAVVIGNTNYENEQIPNVDFAGHDATTIKKYLIQSLGFKESNIIFIENSTLADLKKIFGDERNPRGKLYNRVKDGYSDIFVYYSGHGVPDPNTEKAYLLPSNGDPEAVDFTGYPLDTLYANLRRLDQDKRPASITVAIDACFSGNSSKGALIKSASSIGIRVKSPQPYAGEKIAVLTSSKDDQISSWYPEKRHGLFTYYLLKSLNDSIRRGHSVSISKLRQQLQTSGSVNTMAWEKYGREQQPQIYGDMNIVLFSGRSI